MTATARQPDEIRREPRVPVETKASVRLALGIDLVDVSSIGVRAKITVPLPIGTLVKIGLPRGRSRHARVVWVADGLTGCEFLSPLDSDELSSLFGPML